MGDYYGHSRHERNSVLGVSDAKGLQDVWTSDTADEYP
jgi:hypothetical protein